jgi:Domain of unknown function (DU1801)
VQTDEFKNPQVAEKFSQYPTLIQLKLLFLRQLILEMRLDKGHFISIEETLKWGEPSYLAQQGSTIRMDWKSAKPEQYALYFNCKTKLIDTFKALYGDQLRFEGNRAIIFDLRDEIPVDVLKHCIFLSLTYHDRKHLPLLGC